MKTVAGEVLVGIIMQGRARHRRKMGICARLRLVIYGTAYSLVLIAVAAGICGGIIEVRVRDVFKLNYRN